MNDALTIDTMEALKSGAAEIERLRQENAKLAIKAEAFDTFSAAMALTVPREGRDYAIDVVWSMQRVLAHIEQSQIQPTEIPPQPE